MCFWLTSAQVGHNNWVNKVVFLRLPLKQQQMNWLILGTALMNGIVKLVMVIVDLQYVPPSWINNLADMRHKPNHSNGLSVSDVSRCFCNCRRHEEIVSSWWLMCHSFTYICDSEDMAFFICSVYCWPAAFIFVSPFLFSFFCARFYSIAHWQLALVVLCLLFAITLVLESAPGEWRNEPIRIWQGRRSVVC